MKNIEAANVCSYAVLGYSSSLKKRKREAFIVSSQIISVNCVALTSVLSDASSSSLTLLTAI